MAALTAALEADAGAADWFADRYDPTQRCAIQAAAARRKAPAAKQLARAVLAAARRQAAQPGPEAAAAAGADHTAALAGRCSAVPLAAAVSLGCATRDRRGDLEQPPRLQRVPGVQDAA